MEEDDDDDDDDDEEADGEREPPVDMIDGTEDSGDSSGGVTDVLVVISMG